jgi:DNA-binding NtrC family response regulator
MHVVEAAMVVSDGPELRPEHLPARLRQVAVAPASTDNGGGLPTLEQVERMHIERALRATQGHRGQAAKALGISERNLYRKLREYGVLP